MLEQQECIDPVNGRAPARTEEPALPQEALSFDWPAGELQAAAWSEASFYPWEGAAGERGQFALREDERSFMTGSSPANQIARDRAAFEREALLLECLDAWRFHPLARRIIELTSQYAAGGGMRPFSPHAGTQAFLDAFWQHRLNHMETRITEFSDELARSGNLFVLLSTDPAGMSYARVVPAVQVQQIESRGNDVEQEISFLLRTEAGQDSYSVPAYDEAREQAGQFETVMLHYAVNRPAGAQWGEPDLAPVLRWLSRYSAWLEDRVRLNRFRNSFLYVVKARFASETARAARQAQLAANPPNPGSILVIDESEEWSVIAPRLEALDASTDGLAIKKMIAAGVGLPLHFLAEPESSTRTTAEAAGGPTFRRFAERQRFLCWLCADLLRAAVLRRSTVDAKVDPWAAIRVSPAKGEEPTDL